MTQKSTKDAVTEMTEASPHRPILKTAVKLKDR
jgi:hypothetical protein